MSNILLQCLLGIQCKDFAIIAADQTNSQSVLIMKDDEEKIHKIADKLIMGVNGDPADVVQFAQFISKNIHLYKMRNGYHLDTAAAAHFTRQNLITALRSAAPYTVNLLLAGYDKVNGGQLYHMDYLGSCQKVPYACHGLGGLLSWGILDNNYRFDLTEEKAYEVLKLCVTEVQKRLFINLPNFEVTVVNKAGVNKMPVINSVSLLLKK